MCHMMILRIDRMERTYYLFDPNSGNWPCHRDPNGATHYGRWSQCVLPSEYVTTAGHVYRRVTPHGGPPPDYQTSLEPRSDDSLRASSDPQDSRVAHRGSCTTLVWIVFVCAWRLQCFDLHAVAAAVERAFEYDFGGRVRTDRSHKNMWCGALSWQTELARLAEPSLTPDRYAEIEVLLGLRPAMPCECTGFGATDFTCTERCRPGYNLCSNHLKHLLGAHRKRCREE